MRIGLITTLNWNIGDDLIRAGIMRVLRAAFADQPIDYVPINKHRPMTVYPGRHPARWSDLLPRGRAQAWRAISALAATLGPSRFDDCDLIVQCGAPVLYPGCERSEWAGPLWRHTIGRLALRIPALNLAAGSCYPWERQPSQLGDAAEAPFLRAILGYCRLTTARDALMRDLCGHEGSAVPLLPCTALLALGGVQPVADGPGQGRLLINYMAAGGHYDWGQQIDGMAWEATVRALIARLSPHYRIAFLCHSAAEQQLAATLAPELPRLWPRTVEEYGRLTAGATAALCNRIHAAVGLAGMGIPAVVVGTDTRLGMAQTIGLPGFYVKDASLEAVAPALDRLLGGQQRERERLRLLQASTMARYVELVRAACA